jgi:hypothetical protein
MNAGDRIGESTGASSDFEAVLQKLKAHVR